MVFKFAFECRNLESLAYALHLTVVESSVEQGKRGGIFLIWTHEALGGGA